MQAKIVRLLKVVPFRPFVIIMDSGERVVVRHLENIAYDPGRETANCYALSDGIMHILPWEKIAHAALANTRQVLPHSGDNVA